MHSNQFTFHEYLNAETCLGIEVKHQCDFPFKIKFCEAIYALPGKAYCRVPALCLMHVV
jgi:hypothetical protein